MLQSSATHAEFATAGDYLRYLRRRARLSQRELSIAVGYSESHISRIENNERPIDRSSLLALFVPALGIADEPETIAHLLSLAGRAYGLASVELTAEGAITPSTSDALPQKQGNLPVHLTSFIGRSLEVDELSALLADPQTRLLTLTGVGGSGKTRLALRVAEAVAPVYRHGVSMVELEPISDARMVIRSIAKVFGVHERISEALLSSLCDYLRPRHVLLILDNCEHLIDIVADVAVELLQACLHLQIMATSRETLAIPGELCYAVQPLTLPPAKVGGRPKAAEVADFDAIRLFVARATTVWSRFAFDDDNAPVIVRICRQLDGIPLGIELAAAWLPVLSADQIATRLEHNLDLPVSMWRARMQRHQTLAAAIGWSYQLLTESEQALLRRLAVFRGGWSLHAAEAVAGGLQPLAVSDVLSCLQRLVSKSLVAVDRIAGGDVRYRLLETIRAYVVQHLTASQETRLIDDRHLAYFVDLAETAEPLLKSGQQLYWLAMLDQERENIQAAFVHSVSAGSVVQGLRLAGALGHYWEMRMDLAEADRWCRLVLDAAVDHADLQNSAWRAKALLVAGTAATYQYAHERAGQLLDESLAIYSQLNDAAGAGAALCFIGVTHHNIGELHQAVATYQEAIVASEYAEDTWWIAEHFH